MLQGRTEDEVLVLGEMRVRLVDTRIEHGPDDVAAFGGERRARRVRLHRRDGPVDQRLDLEVGPDPVDGALQGAAARRIRRLAFFVVDPDEATNDGAFEHREDVLLREPGLRDVDALLDARAPEPLNRRGDFLRDPLASRPPPFPVFEIDVDDDGMKRARLPLPLLPQNLEKRNGNDGLVEYFRREG